MATLHRTRRSRLVLVLLVLTSLTLITLDLRGVQMFETARSGALEVFGPVRDTAGSVLEPVGDAWSGVWGYDEMEAENQALREQIADLEGRATMNAESTETLDRLLEELGINYVGDVPTVVASAVSGPSTNFDNTLEVDKGAADGVAPGMPVVTAAGLVGVVERTSEHRAVVMSVADPEFRVGVRLNEHDRVGVARGDGMGRDRVLFTGIDAQADVSEGEIVATSGLERARFPAGIPIGLVSSAEATPGDLDQEVRVTPFGRPAELGFVTIMLWEPPQ